ncbi:Putative integral membrane protein DUF46 [Thioflavicoccus mobilis 8321]|uniref:Putative integral membrane protein DUF46 n=1 Tax=Thioflavicoccus mobilis 8321 TaxID=765912 RepID=L0GVR3_9GAMM|nr:CDP-archaeol synthase [Thioflavicoccus mobilis]AGA90056.1 Putative integral membrane protein DUF46 [Thioflavicoccus mobilis 8321]
MSTQIELFVLIIVANGAPILLDNILGPRLRRPVDGGRVLRDGRRLLGGSVTVRGVVAAVALPAGLAPLLSQGVAVGVVIGLLAMVGDAASSWIKRRLGLASSARAIGLDQVPESLLPLLALAPALDLGWRDIVVIVAAFTAFDLIISRVLYRLGWRNRPH